MKISLRTLLIEWLVGDSPFAFKQSFPDDNSKGWVLFNIDNLDVESLWKVTHTNPNPMITTIIDLEKAIAESDEPLEIGLSNGKFYKIAEVK